MPAQAFEIERVDTPIGPMLVITDDNDCARAADWEDHRERMELLLRRQYGACSFVPRRRPRPSPACRALDAYFTGALEAIASVAVATNGTPFQRQVWAALRQIPTGRTTSYGALAVRIGRPKAVRAVGLANGANPISIIVPCHRVIGSDASLTGYGGGIERKRWLLAHERASLGENRDLFGEVASLPSDDRERLARPSQSPR